MKVRCIDAGPKQNLTVGKVYTVENEFGGLYTIKNDANGVGEYYKRRFEPVDEVAPELNIDMEEIIEVESKKEEVKSMRSLRERVLGKVNYKSIAEQIWDRLEDEIIDEISYSLDEDSIVDDMIHHYKSDYIDVAKEVLIEEFCQDISSDEIEDHIKEIAREKAYE